MPILDSLVADLIVRLQLQQRITRSNIKMNGNNAQANNARNSETYFVQKLNNDSLILATTDKNYYSFDTSDKRNKGDVLLKFIKAK